jgi:hypothetical protein
VTPAPLTLTKEQRELVRRLGAADPEGPPARDWTPVGCAALVLAAAGAGLLPTLARVLGERFGALLVPLLIALAVVGVALWLLGRTIGLAPVHRRVEAAATALAAEAPRLAEGAAPTEPALRAAVALLRDAHHAPGPYTAETFDARAMAERLGAALPLVIAVEAVLLAEQRIYRVFTAEPGPGEASAPGAGGR